MQKDCVKRLLIKLSELAANTVDEGKDLPRRAQNCAQQ